MGAERIVHFPIIDDIIDEDPEGIIIVLDVDTSTAVDVAFATGLRTALGRINDDDRKLLNMQLSHNYSYKFLSYSLLLRI